MTPSEFNQRMNTYATTFLPTMGQELKAIVFSRWAAGQVKHMRDAKGESIRRLKTDVGPLRIVTGDYLRTTRTGGIREVTNTTNTLTFRKGYRPSVTPQSFNETGTRYAPMRATLGPGLVDSLPGTTSIIRRRFVQSLRRAA